MSNKEIKKQNILIVNKWKNKTLNHKMRKVFNLNKQIYQMNNNYKKVFLYNKIHNWSNQILLNQMKNNKPT